MFVVGLTGGIGSGKSTVSDRFQELGIEVVDADLIAREIVAPGSSCLHKIQQKFGNNILLADGSLNRSALRKRVFSDANDRIWLENLTHPVIREAILEKIKKVTSAYTVLAAPLLLESQAYTVDRVLVVDLPLNIQKHRAAIRDGSDPLEIEKIISAQLSREERLKQADDIIDNSRSRGHTLTQVDQLNTYYLQLAQKV